jgi:hypothetical protein
MPEFAASMKKSTPTARTNGSANGSLISGLLARFANARPTATPVAVAPTLVARSQVSLSVRAMSALLVPCMPSRPNLRTSPECGLCVNRSPGVECWP